jgi:tetratricopeptide (TPR) repeat protein
MPSPANVAQAEKLYALGSWHLLRGQLDVAKERLREALALDPGHKAARNDLAGILYRQGAYTAAADTYQSVLQEDETFVPALRGLALALAAQKRYPEAAATLQRILAVNESDPQTLLELGDVLLLGGDPEAARGHWRDATRQPSVSAEILRDARKRLAAVSTQSVK